MVRLTGRPVQGPTQGHMQRIGRAWVALLVAIVFVGAVACTNGLDESQTAPTANKVGADSRVLGAPTSKSRVTPTMSPSAPYNYQDFLFTDRWLTHSGQLINQAVVVRDATSKREVHDFAEQVRGRATGDIEAVTAMRERWRQPVATEPSFGPRDTLRGGDRLITPDSDIPDFTKVDAGERDKRFVEFVIEHNRNALVALDDEVREGKYQETKDAANKTTTTLLAEIKRAQELLQQL